MAVLVLEAGVGALARLYEEQVGPELKMNLNRTFLENYSVRSRETAAIDQMQKEVSTPRDPVARRERLFSSPPPLIHFWNWLISAPYICVRSAVGTIVMNEIGTRAPPYHEYIRSNGVLVSICLVSRHFYSFLRCYYIPACRARISSVILAQPRRYFVLRRCRNTQYRRQVFADNISYSSAMCNTITSLENKNREREKARRSYNRLKSFGRFGNGLIRINSRI